MYCLAIFIDSDIANSVSNYIIDEIDRGDHKSGLRTSSWARESIILLRDAPLNSVLSKVPRSINKKKTTHPNVFPVDAGTA